jgi:hypothetical protein
MKQHHESKDEPLELSPMRTFLLVGTFMLTMLCFIPLWNAVALMRDETFVHLVGEGTPVCIAVCCSVVIAVYFLTILIFFRTSRPEHQTEHSILLIASLFLTLLGTLLLLLSTPLASGVESAYLDLWNNCQFGMYTKELAEASQALSILRAMPDCRDHVTIETCKGYKFSPQARVLQAMENNFRCSGFCYQPSVNASAGTASASTLMQMHQQPLVMPSDSIVETNNLLQVFSDGSVTGAHADTPVPIIAEYPPTLFSRANYQSACDSMAARNIKSFAGDIAHQTFYEGFMLVVVASVVSLMKLLTLCVRPSSERGQVVKGRPGMGYGSMPAH